MPALRHPAVLGGALAAALWIGEVHPAAARTDRAASPATETAAATEGGVQLARAKILEVSPAMGAGRQAAERQRLLREFPEDLVEELWIQDWMDLERAYRSGRLVDVPNDPEGLGYELRLDGMSRIGELEDDALKQALLCRLSKPAAGLLFRVASRMRLIEGEAYEPLQITSLVRTWDYQLRLTEVNGNADRTREGVPPTHVLGLAFDIARNRLGPEREKRLEAVLDDLAALGELAFYKEGGGHETYHVIALPSAGDVLARHYERISGEGEKRVEAVARHRGVLDSPCVTFGSSLEPYSSICHCELPVEASAAGGAAVAH